MSQLDHMIPLDMVEQLPGYLCITDLENKWIGTNKSSANAVGYKSVSSVLGTSISDIRCSAAESSEDFRRQNSLVISSKKDLTILDIHTYTGGDVKILLTKKNPYLVDNKIKGVIALGTELDTRCLQKLTAALVSSDAKYHNQKKLFERSYQLNQYTDSLLTVKEQDILCYLIRGKTMREIAEILIISPRTVEWYVENLKDKLGCTRKSEIIEIGILRGYLNIIPQSLLKKELSKTL